MRTVVASVPKGLALTALKNCVVCRKKSYITKPPVGRPIRSSGIWGRVQMDLIDMRTHANGEYRWILHIKDHTSKFSYSKALRTKQCVEVAAAVREVFYLYGPSSILQHDRGLEFMGRQMREMIAADFPTVKVSNKL